MQALDSALSVSGDGACGAIHERRGRARIYPGIHAVAGPMCITSDQKHPVVPKTKQLDFDTNTQAGTDDNGHAVTFAQIYSWMGETAREQIFAVLNRVLSDPSLTLKVFAYDLNEPDIVKILLTLAEQGRVRIIRDPRR